MDRFRSLEIFAKSAERLNFAAAARDLNLTRAMISKHIGDLEAHLGTRLFQRTTRRVNLTEAGRALAARAAALIEGLNETENAVRELHTVLTGKLRVNAPVAFGTAHLTPLIVRFLGQHPGVDIDLTLNDRKVDLVEEGYDVVVRIAEPTDSSLIARRLAPARLVVVAAPEYLKTHGMPKTPTDLRRHNCLGYAYAARRDEWPLVGPDGKHAPVRIKGSMISNNGDALRLAAIEGLGLLLQPTFSIGDDLAAGRLVHVMRDYTAPELTVHALYAPGAAPNAKLRAFIDLLAKSWSGTPPWDRWMKRTGRKIGKG